MSSSVPSAPEQPSAHHHITRPLDATAIAIILLLCLSWGFNQVAVKLTIHDIPPLMQGALRSAIAAVLVAAWCLLRGMRMFERDGTLRPGLFIGALFGVEFILVFQGLAFTTATRATVFLYLAPFFVVVGSRVLLPGDRFRVSQWIGLILSFAGMVVAFGVPTPAVDPRQTLGDILVVGGAMLWAAVTLTVKSSPSLNAIAPEKVMLYQLVISAPMLAIASWFAGEQVTHWPDHLALGGLLYQSVWVVSVTFVLWFAVIKNFSASRVSSFTFLAPLFGVAAGHFVIGDPVTPAFLAALAFVAAGLVLVNRPG